MMKNIVFYGHNTLRQKAEKITTIDDSTLDLIDTMFNLMYQEKGIGLAAPQVAVPKQLIVIDIELYKGPRLELINPVIYATSDEEESFNEGCLSVPGINADIIRPYEVSVRALTPEGKEITFDAGGLLARVLQHEIDHLNGILFIDHLDDFIRKEFATELKKIKKMNRAS